MSCDCTEKISSLIDGELSQDEGRELERHLMNCVECQEARADFLNLRSQIAEFPVSFRPVAQRDALEHILGKEKVASGSRAVGRRWVFNPAVAALASLLIVGAVIALLIYPKLKRAPVAPDEIARNPDKKPTPRPVPSPSVEGTQKGGGQNNSAPKSSPPPASNKNQVPNKKRAPLVIGPPQDNIAKDVTAPQVHSADAETMTAIHFEKSELLLRSFRNVRLNKSGRSAELGYEKRLAQKLVYQNMMLRREADASGDTQVASLLESLEPILLDIANLPDNARQDDVQVIKDRVERKNIVALLQVNSALARALD